jgi:hypothetical protein
LPQQAIAAAGLDLIAIVIGWHRIMASFDAETRTRICPVILAGRCLARHNPSKAEEVKEAGVR